MCLIFYKTKYTRKIKLFISIKLRCNIYVLMRFGIWKKKLKIFFLLI